MQEFKVDYHIHTAFSDGQMSPARLVRQAKDLEYDIISITDLNTVEGLFEATIAAEAVGLTLVSGVEIGARTEEGIPIRILGYRFDPKDGPLISFLEESRSRPETDLPLGGEAIRAITEAGGIPVLADPAGISALGSPEDESFYEELGRLLTELRKQGLKGLECFCPRLTDPQARRVAELAGKHHLHILRGSGFKGADYAEAARPGDHK